METRADRQAEADQWLTEQVKQGRAEPFAGIFEITVERAIALLERNTGNRNVRKLQVGKIREDIRAKRWEMNGESLVISREGLLNDGQHRLRAIIEAGVTVRAVVVFGVTRESRRTLDLGANRGPEDVLHFLGHHYASTTASVARLALAFDKSEGKTFQPLKWISKTEIVERAHGDEEITEAVTWATSRGGEIRQLLAASPLAFCRYVLNKVHPEQAEVYLTGLIEGANLPSGAPALAVRRYLFTLSKRGDREAAVAMVLRGWALFVQGRHAEPGDIHGRLPLPGIGLAPAEEEPD